MKDNGKSTYSGWFSVFGDSGRTFETIFTVVISIVAVLIFIISVFFLVKAGIKLAGAEDAEQRSEAKKQMLWIVVGATVGLLATIVPTILWNTVGKFSIAHDQITSGTGTGR